MFDVYTTDGTLVKNQKGDFMGIFSTVALLNDKGEQNYKMIQLLKEIAGEDFRGNRSDASVKAFNLLKEMGIK